MNSEPSKLELRNDANPFVFVVGCPRSGTTLLQRMLDHHPLLSVANDTHFIPRGLEKFAPESIADATAGKSVALTPRLIEGVRGYHRFHRLGLDEDAVARASAESTTYRDYVGTLYTSFAARHGKPLGGEKTPDYVRRLPLLHGLFPWAKLVHIVRDGRDVALSALDWAGKSKGPGKLRLWETEPVATCALWWRWQVGAGRSSGAQIGEQHYHEVGYEGLVAEPDGQLRCISDFLGLPYEPAMLAYNEGKIKTNPKLSAKKRWLSPTAGLRNWRSEMEPPDVEMFEAVAGDLLDELGYERAFPEISPQVRRVAACCLDWWDEFLARREAKTRLRLETKC